MKKVHQKQQQHQSTSDRTTSDHNSQSLKPDYLANNYVVKLSKQVLEAAKSIYFDVEIKIDDIQFSHPTLEEHGDYATNIALKLSKLVGRPPLEIANKIGEKLKKSEDKIEIVAPGFINFFLGQKNLMEEIVTIDRLGDNYGSSKIGQGKTVVVDYSAPNIAKRFGIGHLRSTIIGQSLYNLYKFLGYQTIGDNHLGDWGTQFGKLLYMISSRNEKELSLDKLEELYVAFHEEAEKDPQLNEKGRLWFKKLEDGDSEARQLWKKCVEISMVEFEKIYKLLDVKIDYAYGESFYEDKMLAVVNDAKSKNISRESEGAVVIDIPGEKIPLILLKSDGATTYATRDLATLKYRFEQWHPEVVIYEVGGEQALHFVQVFAAARMLGYASDQVKLIHTRHGLYRWEHGKMRTRKGDTVKLDDILTEAVKRATQLGNSETAKDVGIGAIKYFDLKHNVTGDIIFDWEKMFELQGDSGPYLQYTYARARSVLRKAQPNWEFTDGNLKLEPEEEALLRYLYRFPEVVEIAARMYSPNLLCTYLYELSRRYNNMYNNVSIIGSENESWRLGLTNVTSIVLANGLNLLGIKALEKM